MYNFVNLPQDVRHLLEPVQNQPGFVRLPYQEWYSVYFHPVIAELFKKHDIYVKFTEAQYISPRIVKDNVRKLVHYSQRANDSGSYLASLIMGSCSIRGTDSKSETTAEVTISIKAPDGSPIVRGSVDHVPAVRLLFWPHEAAGWVIRTRIWPPQDIIQSIVDKGCQLVPRSSPGGDIHSEWRLSFSGPEAVLAQLRSKEQQQAYYFFKILFYRYLKGVKSSEGGKALYSYIMKTTMMWACEEILPEDPVWTSLESSVQVLLFKLLGGLEVGCVPHYFIPEINLLQGVGEDVKDRCIATISRLQNNILMTAPFDMPEKREFVTKINTYLKHANELKDLFNANSDFENVKAMMKSLFPKEGR